MLEESYAQTAGSRAEQLIIGRVRIGKRVMPGRFRTLLQFLGPAFIVSVAYIDPPEFVLERMDF